MISRGGLMAWVTEGQHHDLEKSNIFINSSIENFLNSKDVLFLIASKGMGKTMLLRYKKHLVNSEWEKNGITILPENETVDSVRFTRNITDDLKPLLSTDKLFWKDIWEISICMSVILSYPFDSDEERSHCYEDLKSILRHFHIFNDQLEKFKAKRIKVNTSDIISKLITFATVSDLKRLINEHLHDITNVYKCFIRSGVCVFIDNVDSALREATDSKNDIDIWVNGQLGLINAAWEIYRQNPHIKVFTSIRQEAFSKMRDENAMALTANSLVLKYSKDELRKIFELAILTYEDKDKKIITVEDFVGVKKIFNKTVNIEEDPFDYIYRHSIGTPRSILVMGDSISKQLDRSGITSDANDKIREIIAYNVSQEIAKSYLTGEMKYFLITLQHEDNIYALFRKLNSNILSHNFLIRSCNRSNKCKNVLHDRCYNCKRDTIKHSFCELYNVGLLGYVHDHLVKGKIQKFKKPYEYDWQQINILPNSPYYVVHPSLRRTIRRYNSKYKINSSILVGDEVKWLASYQGYLDKEKICIFISYSSTDSSFVEPFIKDLNNTADEESVRVDIWYDKWKIKNGDWIQQSVEKGLKDSHFMIVILSNKGLESGWVEREWRSKFEAEIAEKRIKVFFVLLDNDHANLPPLLEGKQVSKVTRRNYRKRKDIALKIIERIKTLSAEVSR